MESFKLDDPEYARCLDKNGYPWVYIVYDGHEGFACDWGDCLEEIFFIYGHSIIQNFIKWDDPKLEYIRRLYIRNGPVSKKTDEEF